MTVVAQIMRQVNDGEWDVDHDVLLTWPDDNPDFASWLLSDMARDSVAELADTEERTQNERI